MLLSHSDAGHRLTFTIHPLRRMSNEKFLYIRRDLVQAQIPRQLKGVERAGVEVSPIEIEGGDLGLALIVLAHQGVGAGRLLDVDLFEADLAVFEETLGAGAIRAPRRGVNLQHAFSLRLQY